MTFRPERLPSRLLAWQAIASVAAAVLIGVSAPYLVLLEGSVAVEGPLALAWGIIIGGTVGMLRNSVVLHRFRYLLRALALRSGSIESYELQELGEQPRNIALGWALPCLIGLLFFTVLLRPAVLDLTTGVTLCFLGTLIVAAASMLLLVIVRASILDVLELAPPETMSEVVKEAPAKSLEQRIALRLWLAVFSPVGFMALGAALIANAHLRRADERGREESARALARAALELGPGVVEGAGLSEALAAADRLGFDARVVLVEGEYYLEQGEQGLLTLQTPLDRGSARVTFSGSTVGVLSYNSLLVALLAMATAAAAGAWLGRSVRRDLRNANLSVRLLGTDTVLRGARVMVPARFRTITELESGIEQLAGRFRVFAKAQERAISSRERAARMRGLFFASVSHDLKSPLNAILGFTELVQSTETTTSGQSESLGLIERRGRELLALVETILDAARVEVGQLTLVYEEIDAQQLMDRAAEIGRDLASDTEAQLITEVAGDTPTLIVDAVRLVRALGTFIGHALRTSDQPRVYARAYTHAQFFHVEVDVPSHRFSANELSGMVDPSRGPAPSEHRGLALGLNVAGSIVDLHGGNVRISAAPPRGVVFNVALPVVRTTRLA